MSRRKPPATQASLFGATPAPTIVRETIVYGPDHIEHRTTFTEKGPPADALPLPKLRLVHSVLDWDVVVEAAGDDAFWVTRTRDTGTASSGMLFTRTQLERLIVRCQAALKVT